MIVDVTFKENASVKVTDLIDYALKRSVYKEPTVKCLQDILESL